MQRQTWKRSALLAAGVLWMVASGVKTTHAEAPEVFSTWSNWKPVFSNPTTVLWLYVPPGHYTVESKLFVSSDFQTRVMCSLQAENDFDISVVALDPSKEQIVVNTVVHSFSGPVSGRIDLVCQAPTPTTNTVPTRVEFVKVTATKVNSVSNEPFEH